MNKRKIIAIVGPTASGKTGIGVRLAKEFDGEIVSADSRQVYRGLDIGTGKEGLPGGQPAESRKPKAESAIEKLKLNLCYIDDVPQWMIDVAEPEEKLTLFDYLPLARAAIEDILRRGKLPIIVGGTGLYVQGLVQGFALEQSKVESRKSKVSYSRAQLDNLTIQQLNNILEDLDAEKFETIDHKNSHRLIRAIELAQEGMKPIKVKPDYEVLQIGLDLPRAELHERIDKRVDERFEAGMLEEVVGLLKQGVSPEWLIGLGLEYREITSFVESGIRNNESRDRIRNTKYEIRNTAEFKAMAQRLKFRIHQFARRQLTWFRRFPEINWLSDYKEIKRFVKIFLEH